MKSLKFKVISTAILAGVLSTAMAATDPKPFYPLSDFTQGTTACMTYARDFGNDIWNHDWPINEVNTYLPYANLFQSTFGTPVRGLNL